MKAKVGWDETREAENLQTKKDGLSLHQAVDPEGGEQSLECQAKEFELEYHSLFFFLSTILSFI